jgi:hypothetical protein
MLEQYLQIAYDCLFPSPNELIFHDHLPVFLNVAVNTPPAELTRVYPKVSGLDAWSENRKWYNSLPLGAVVSLFCESV